MRKHSRLTPGQRALAVSVAALVLADAPVFFVVMFFTVNDLLGPYFNGWAWTVPVATEISFTILFLLGVLFTWADRAPGWLLVAPYPFALASLALNVYGAHGNVPAMIGHAVVTVAFFLPLIAVKAAVRRFAASDEMRRRDQAVADVIAHAKDILRAADRWWRFRAPLLLRRQLRSRRLPAAVVEAIEQGVMFGGATKWEPVVEAWITRSLALPEGVSAQLAAARREAVQSVPQTTPAAVPQASVEQAEPPAPVRPEATPQARPRRAAKPALKLPASKSRSMSPEQLAVHAQAMKDEYGSVSINRIKDDLSVGTEKAKKAHLIVYPESHSSGAEIVRMEARRA